MRTVGESMESKVQKVAGREVTADNSSSHTSHAIFGNNVDILEEILKHLDAKSVGIVSCVRKGLARERHSGGGRVVLWWPRGALVARRQFPTTVRLMGTAGGGSRSGSSGGCSGGKAGPGGGGRREAGNGWAGLRSSGGGRS
ncbi:glycine-rich RNA-binding protein 1-like [Cryptomeria japonica]|uniref:glycine-rich RNA-binding protein 1-like n=1 Tax=Cryptomeria japonica TaxID=3369 RepID=UPI0027DA9048|nr:glycine-rich RNA-binding protein 1-like [Cryptomeria japonica]